VTEYWSIGVLEYWSIGVLECWNLIAPSLRYRGHSYFWLQLEAA
jgi:hypothetical protein